MYKLTKDGYIAIKEEYDIVDKNFHYLAFAYHFGGYDPLNEYVTKINPSVSNDEQPIFETLLKKQEVCTLYPMLNLTLYPFKNINDGNFEPDLKNIDKHFADILKINDEVYKAEKMYVHFGQGLTNFNQELVFQKLRELLNKSKYLKDIYFEFLL